MTHIKKALEEVNHALMEIPVNSKAFRHLCVARMELLAAIQKEETK